MAKLEPAVRFPDKGEIRATYQIDCAGCAKVDPLAAISRDAAMMEARARSWRRIHGRWYCPRCVAAAQ